MIYTALLVIDVQVGLDDPSLGKRNNPGAEANMALLLSQFRVQSWPVVHIQHGSVEPASPLRPDLPGFRIKPEVAPLPTEPVLFKSVNSAFVGTGLEQLLHDLQVSSLVVVGLTTDHCVSASTRMASDLGFSVTLVSDATATHEREGHDGSLYTAEQMHNINLASLNGEFCQVKTCREVLEDMVREGNDDS